MEEIIFKVGVETGDAKSKIDGVTEAVKKTVKETEKAGGSFTNMRKELKNLTLQLQNLDPASKEFEKVAQRAGQIKEQMRGVADAINDADPEKFGGKFQRTAEGIAGAFSAVTGAQAIFGGSSEEIEKQMLKVQGAIALTQGISAMKELRNDFGDLATMIKGKVVSAFGSLRSALISTGIGALVIIITSIIANWNEFSSSITKSFPALAKIGAYFNNIKQIASGVINGLIEGFKSVGKIMLDLLTGDVSSAWNEAKNFGSNVSKAYNQGYAEKDKELKTKHYIESTKQQLDLMEAQGKDVSKKRLELLKKELTLLKKGSEDYNAKLVEIETLRTSIKQKQADKQKEINAKSKENEEKNEAERLAKLKERQELQNKINDLIIANIEDTDMRELLALREKHRRELEEITAQYGKKKEFSELEKKLKENQNKEEKALIYKQKADKKEQEDKDEAERLAKEKAKKDKENLNAKSKIEAEIIALENDFAAKQEKKVELENLDFAQQLQNKELTNGEIQKITAQHEANLVAIGTESKDRQIEIDNAIAEAKFNLANNIGSAIGALGGLFAQGSKQAKAFALIQIGIDTATGFMSALTIAQQSAKATGPGAAVAMPIFYASQVAAVLQAVGRAKSILGSSTSVQAPTINTTGGIGSNGGNSGVSVNQQDTEVRAQSTYKVVVVDSDITKMQEKTKKVELISSI
jgi:hypothetical protein